MDVVFEIYIIFLLGVMIKIKLFNVWKEREIIVLGILFNFIKFIIRIRW